MLKDNRAVLPLSVTLILACRSWEAYSSNEGLLVWVISQNWQDEATRDWLVLRDGWARNWEWHWLGLGLARTV